jgi:hypothetical protein
LTSIQSAANNLFLLTTNRLQTIADAAGITKGLTKGTIQYNRAVGLAFQNFVLESTGQQENLFRFDSPARAAATMGKRKSVVPDAAGDIEVIQLVGKRRIPAEFHAWSVFTEVKAWNGVIGLSTSYHQMEGLIDALSSSSGGQRKPSLATLWLVTTADTVIGPDVKAYATQKGVALYQSYVLVVPAAPDPKNQLLAVLPGFPLNAVPPPGDLIPYIDIVRTPGAPWRLTGPKLRREDEDPTEIGPPGKEP